MTTTRLLLLSACASLALAGCEERAPAPAEVAATRSPAASSPASLMGFGRTGEPQTGYFSAVGDPAPKVGDLELAYIGVAGPEDFDAWEAGTRMDTFGPVMVVMNDVSSGLVPDEMGGESYKRVVRVLPTAYEAGPGRLRFSGTDEDLGAVSFDGVVDEALMAKHRAEGAGQEPVMTGTLTAGGRTFSGVKFVWSVGD